MLRERQQPREDTFTMCVILPKDGLVAIGPFDYPAEADAHAKAIRLEDYTLLTVVPPRARLRIV
jgi:hypothetical protein